MMKRILSAAFLLLTMTMLHAQQFETATEAVRNMGVGWNLGNTLDAHGEGVQQGLESEIYWGQPYTRQALMAMLKEAGFGTVRVPVTWYNHMDQNGKVDAAWMERVRQVVDYVLSQGMYCLLNVHHDTGEGNVHWLHANMDTYQALKTKFEYLWQQIAEEFRDYDQRLLFEGYNEMLDKYDSWCFATYAAPGRYIAADAADAYNAINSYAQSFVNAVRATGGNNAKRNLVVNTYGACNGSGNWNQHLVEPLTQMNYPSDPAGAGHIAFQVHCYPNVTNLSNAKNEVNSMMSLLKTHLVSKGGPVIIGEWGTANNNETDYLVRRDNVLQFAGYFVQKAKEEGMATIKWMGISDAVDRSLPVFTQPDLAEAILKAWYGSSYQPVLPTRDDLGETIYEVQYNSQWSELHLVSNTIPTASYSRLELVLAETPATGTLQYKVYPTEKTQTVTASSSTLTLSTSTMGASIQRITLQNMLPSARITVKDVQLVKTDGTKTKMIPSPFWGCTVNEVFTSVSPVRADRPADGQYYDLLGRRVSRPAKGIYLLNGRKYIF